MNAATRLAAWNECREGYLRDAERVDVPDLAGRINVFVLHHGKLPVLVVRG